MGNDMAKEEKKREENAEYIARMRQMSRNAATSEAPAPRVPSFRPNNPPPSTRPNAPEMVAGLVLQRETVTPQKFPANAKNKLSAQEIIKKCNDLHKNIYPNLMMRAENIDEAYAAGENLTRAEGNAYNDPNKNTGRARKESLQNNNYQPQVQKERSPMYEGDRRCNSTAMMGNAPSTSAGLPRDGANDFVMVDNYYHMDHNARPHMPSAPFENDLPAEPRNKPRNQFVNRLQRRSASGQRSELCCETCNQEFGLEQIFHCNSGHSACERCKLDGLRCGRCNTNLLDMRNFAIEEHVRDSKTPCPNSPAGCSLHLRRVDLPGHLAECIYREMDCPARIFGLCTWKGKRGVEMLRHFDEYHREHREGYVDQEMCLRHIENDARHLYLVPIGGYLFLFHVKISKLDQTLSMGVQLIGTRSQASKWTYKIDIYNKSEPRRKIEYLDKCLPDGDHIADVFKESRGFVLPLGYAQSYVSEVGLLYKFYITRPEEDFPKRTKQAFRGGRGGKRGISR